MTGHPRARTHGHSTVITFWAHNHPDSVRCRLDGGALRRCASPVWMRKLRYGDHRLRVQAENEFGTVVLTIRWTVLDVPASTVTSSPVYVSPPVLEPTP